MIKLCIPEAVCLHEISNKSNLDNHIEIRYSSFIITFCMLEINIVHSSNIS